MHEKKISTKLQGSMSEKNKIKNHESNTKITAQNVESTVVVVHCRYIDPHIKKNILNKNSGSNPAAGPAEAHIRKQVPKTVFFRYHNIVHDTCTLQ